MDHKALGWVCVWAALVVGCASAPPGDSAATGDRPETEIPQRPALPAAQRARMTGAANVAAGPTGPPATFAVRLGDITGESRPGLIELRTESDAIIQRIQIPNSPHRVAVPSGAYKVYSYIYDASVPFLVDIQPLTVTPDNAAALSVSVLEGSVGGRPLSAFDQDVDLVIDSLEAKHGTDPQNPLSAPGLVTFDWPSPVLKKQTGWYKGELHAHSSYGIGNESVRDLVRRAERSGLDFLAIADRNSLESAVDPGYQSDSVVLIPAMEWGDDNRGVALIYGPRAFPRPANTFEEAQAVILRAQAQGGLCAVAHPLFPTAPWQWALGYMNAVEVWCRDWRRVPPTQLQALDPRMRERSEGQLIHSVAIASATDSLSANAQASLFWDLETLRGLKASVIAGSYSSSSRVPLGSPITYVYAEEKSLNGILDGLRRGRTFVSNGPDGPTVMMSADMLDDGSIDAIIGDVVPLDVPTKFYVEVQRGMGKRLEVLLNGRPLRTREIDANEMTYTFTHVPEHYSVYRARVVEPGETRAFGYLDVNAMSSPIYAQRVIPLDPNIGENAWVDVPSEYVDEEIRALLVPSDPSVGELRPPVLNR